VKNEVPEILNDNIYFAARICTFKNKLLTIGKDYN